MAHTAYIIQQMLFCVCCGLSYVMRTQSFHAGNIISALYGLVNTTMYKVGTDTKKGLTAILIMKA